MLMHSLTLCTLTYGADKEEEELRAQAGDPRKEFLGCILRNQCTNLNALNILVAIGAFALCDIQNNVKLDKLLVRTSENQHHSTTCCSFKVCHHLHHCHTLLHITNTKTMRCLSQCYQHCIGELSSYRKIATCCNQVIHKCQVFIISLCLSDPQ